MHGLCKAFDWSLHFSFRNTKITVVVVVGVGMVTSLPPAAPARIEPMLFSCSTAASSRGAPNCYTSHQGMSPALDSGYQSTPSLPLQSEQSHPQAELSEEQEQARHLQKII